MSVESLIVSDRINRNGRWCYFDEWNCCICFPQKNGGNAFRKKLKTLKRWESPKMAYHIEVFSELQKCGHGPFTPKEADIFYPNIPHYLAVRHPLDRFKSLWRNKCRDRVGHPKEIYGLSPDELMDFIERNSNSHWMSQSMYVTTKTIPVRHSVLLDRMGSEKVNKTESRDDDPEFPVDRVLRHYAADLKLWEQANSDL